MRDQTGHAGGVPAKPQPTMPMPIWGWMTNYRGCGAEKVGVATTYPSLALTRGFPRYP